MELLQLLSRCLWARAISSTLITHSNLFSTAMRRILRRIVKFQNGALGQVVSYEWYHNLFDPRRISTANLLVVHVTAALHFTSLATNVFDHGTSSNYLLATCRHVVPSGVLFKNVVVRVKVRKERKKSVLLDNRLWQPRSLV